LTKSDLVNKEKIPEIVFKALESSDVFCLVTNSHGKIIYSNNGALKIMNYSMEELTGKSVYSILLNSSGIERTLKTKKFFKGFIEGKQKLGENFYLYSEIYPVEENGRLSGFVYLGEKILGKEKLEGFSHVEDFDIITGLPHKKAFFALINTNIERHHEPFSLLLIDICGFSHISITYGTDFSEAQGNNREAKEASSS